MITERLIQQVLPRCKKPREWAQSLEPACQEFGITTPDRVAMFLAQISAETADLTALKENLKYSAERLVEVWPHRFPTLEAAAPYAMNERALANYVYANRMGNGAPETGDGWSFRGQGAYMFTGKDRFLELTRALKFDYLNNPEHVCSYRFGGRPAAWYFAEIGGKQLADDQAGVDDQNGDFVTLSKRVNGGTIGLQERKRAYARACAALGLKDD